ncbi:hypothetical protein GMORB2_6778 [Geosmithia morbida]|uniref:Stress activated MAP kinase interacting protein Sin1 n=1 Tax=Geosmithia morbida TaxID=1094350 RepID=A0A9P5D0X9_9HYPO|nr:uncharacterized protein GMORB2_6778 [Geosmithia morbida]KAF4123228.1 hypothetical protein GMORB2_6778 [Geosmithia morbida]
MSVIQVEELVSYQLRTSYLDEIADGVGERLLTVNEGYVNSPAFKAAGWRPDSSHAKRTHSPPIPTAIASEYFQAPRRLGFTLEEGDEDGDGAGMLTGGGADTIGPGTAATKRRRRREQMEEEDDSSDLSDESEDESDQRAVQQIKFAKMPVRHRAGSSPIQSSAINARQQPTAPSPRSRRRGSHSAMGAVKNRPRRDTVTSSEISSDNEMDSLQQQRQNDAATRILSGVRRGSRLEDRIQEEEPLQGIKRADTSLLPEEEEEEEEDDDDEDSDEGSDMSGDYVGSIDSASILDVADTPVNTSPTRQVVGTPPKNYMRQSTIRKSQLPLKHLPLEALPPPRPMSTIRPMSVMQPKSLLSAALKARENKPSIPFQKFAHLSGQGTRGSIAVRVYPAFSDDPGKSFEVLIRPRVQDGQNVERVVTVVDLIGLSLYRYNEEKRDPSLRPERLNVNWWTLRMVEEGGEVDDDFPPFERTKPLSSFTTVNNANMRGGGRMRSNSTAYDEFALVEASADEFEENKQVTPEEDEEEQQQQGSKEDEQSAQQLKAQTPATASAAPTTAAPVDGEGGAGGNSMTVPSDRPRMNPILTTTYRPNTPLADKPAMPPTTVNTMRGQQKLLRIHMMLSDTAPGQTVTVDVTTDTYLAEVLEVVCSKRQLDKGNHVLKLPGSGAVVMIDRPVSSIGNVSDLELYRRRFATDGPLTMTGSPSSTSPKVAAMAGGGGSVNAGVIGSSSVPGAIGGSGMGGDGSGGGGGGGGGGSIGGQPHRKVRKGQMLGPHPLAREIAKQDELGNANYKKYTVWRKQPMRIVGLSERILVIDGEYIHIVPASGGRALVEGGGKTTTVHFSNVIGCKVPRKHPTNVKLVVYKATESKRYDFETRGAGEAAEIVQALKTGISPYREV